MEIRHISPHASVIYNNGTYAMLIWRSIILVMIFSRSCLRIYSDGQCSLDRNERNNLVFCFQWILSPEFTG